MCKNPGLQINLPPGRFNQKYQYTHGLASQCQNDTVSMQPHPKLSSDQVTTTKAG